MGDKLENLISDLKNLTLKLDEKGIKMLDLDLFERILRRLDSFSPECDDCANYFKEFEGEIDALKMSNTVSKDFILAHKKKTDQVTAHLQERHNLISEGYYASVYMCIGLSIGLVFGLAIFENIAIGMPIGMCLGFAIGSSKDSQAEKDGLVI